MTGGEVGMNKMVVRILVYVVCIIIGLLLAKWIWSLDIPDWMKVWLIS